MQGVLLSMRVSRTILILSALFALTALFAVSAAVAASGSNKTSMKRGTKYLQTRGITAFTYTGLKADAISAVVAGRRSGARIRESKLDELVESLEKDTAGYAVSAGAIGKLLMASTAAEKRPRCFGATDEKVDLVAALGQYYDDGRYGQTAFDHALAILGLVAAGEHVPSAAISFAKSRRGSHGWNFAMSSGTGDDVESTAMMIQALRAAGVKRSDSHLRKAYRWMTYQRNPQDGYNPETIAGDTNANATALAIEAASTMGKTNAKSKYTLRKQQHKDGYFNLTPTAADDVASESKILATAESVVALSGRHYPVSRRSRADRSCVS